MPKPITVSKPFPTTDKIYPDCVSLKIISPAYASASSELNTILQYIYHSFFFEAKGYKEIYEQLSGISVAEMLHLDLLGKTIYALGAAPTFTQYPPNYFNFYSTKFVSASRSLKEMLEDDIVGEKNAISGYRRMLKTLKNEAVSEIVSRILEDEILHLSVLEKLLSEFKC